MAFGEKSGFRLYLHHYGNCVQITRTRSEARWQCEALGDFSSGLISVVMVDRAGVKGQCRPGQRPSFTGGGVVLYTAELETSSTE